MLSETSWLDILSFFTASVFGLIGLFFYYMVKSFMNRSPVAKSTPINQFLHHLSNIGQVLILSSFFDLFVFQTFY